ncbi:S8 family peptidase [Streptomyces sp. NPDC012888]|uniref:S8 family peptidase n=1 Tax=Streptomyces sp. NPDC012888 TaxID=3364855 RepID=UPI003682DF9B
MRALRVPAALLTAGLLFAPATPVSAQPARPAPAAATAEGWIVVLKAPAGPAAAAAAVPTTARELLARAPGARLGHLYTAALSGFSARLTRAQASRLAADPRVAYVQPDVRVSLDSGTLPAAPATPAATVAPAATQPNAPWGLDRIDQRRLPLSTTYTYRTTADAVRVYVIDTGVRTTHAEFGGRASVGTDTVGDGRGGQDCHGHGTHMAGIATGAGYGVAKAARPVAVRVLDCTGSASTSGVIAGIDWVTANAVRPAVANMSLGGGASTALDEAVRNSIRSGITYTVSAGSQARPDGACGTSPSRVAETVSVGASDRLDRRASSSNYGACVSLFAPGVQIPSAWKDGDTATATISGTSTATAHAAGAAALHLAFRPADTPAQVKAALVGNATAGVLQGTPPVTPNRLLYTLYVP